MRVKVGDIHLFFDVEGANLTPDDPTMRERPTLLLLHGGPGFDHSSFKPAFSQLVDVAQVIYLDHRGQGRSDRSDLNHWNLDQWADDVRAFCDALLKEIRCPTLVIAGEEDPVTPVADSEDIMAALPPHLARFQRFPGCGHGVYRDDPDAYFSAVREFIAND